MAKRDQSDKTPIQFYVPGVGGGRNKVPTPINQPHWKYLKEESIKSKPVVTFFFILGGVTLLVFAILVLISGINEVFQYNNWSATTGLMAVFLILSVVGISNLTIAIKQIKLQKKLKNTSPPKKKPKYPKRPKNYR